MNYEWAYRFMFHALNLLFVFFCSEELVVPSLSSWRDPKKRIFFIILKWGASRFSILILYLTVCFIMLCPGFKDFSACWRIEILNGIKRYRHYSLGRSHSMFFLILKWWNVFSQYFDEWGARLPQPNGNIGFSSVFSTTTKNKYIPCYHQPFVFIVHE